MDPERRQALEQIEPRIGQSVHGEIRASVARMRGHVDATAEDTRRHVEATAEQTRRHVDQVAEETRRRVDLVAQETRRPAVMMVERLRSDFPVATVGFMPLNRRMDAVEGQGEQTKQRPI